MIESQMNIYFLCLFKTFHKSKLYKYTQEHEQQQKAHLKNIF